MDTQTRTVPAETSSRSPRVEIHYLLTTHTRRVLGDTDYHYRLIWGRFFDRLSLITGVEIKKQAKMIGIKPMDYIQEFGLMPRALELARELYIQR